jgi:hypothetical protein
MGKVSEADFAEIGGRLRAKALSIMADLDQRAMGPTPAPAAPPASVAVACGACGKPREADARFCKFCGAPLT